MLLRPPYAISSANFGYAPTRKDRLCPRRSSPASLPAPKSPKTRSHCPRDPNVPVPCRRVTPT
eukprot:3273526-Rhodomonas_salina.2